MIPLRISSRATSWSSVRWARPTFLSRSSTVTRIPQRRRPTSASCSPGAPTYASTWTAAASRSGAPPTATFASTSPGAALPPPRRPPLPLPRHRPPLPPRRRRPPPRFPVPRGGAADLHLAPRAGTDLEVLRAGPVPCDAADIAGDNDATTGDEQCFLRRRVVLPPEKDWCCEPRSTWLP